MPGDEYSTAISGGLKLKGVNSSSKISKHKKKKPKPEANPTEDSERSKDESSKIADEAEDPTKESPSRLNPEEDIPSKKEDATPPPEQSRKTEAELRHEERRRKRVNTPYFYTHSNPLLLTDVQLDERLKREGTKTHKERVEELNRYLSNLSEHHDMPRIGPG